MVNKVTTIFTFCLCFILQAVLTFSKSNYTKFDEIDRYSSIYKHQNSFIKSNIDYIIIVCLFCVENIVTFLYK